MPLLRFSLAAAVLGPVAVLAVPAVAAAAPTLAPLKPCYDAASRGTGGTEPVAIAGSGFTPGALVDVAVDGTVVAAGVPVDASGALAAGSVSAPYVASGRRAFTVTATEQGDAAQTAAATSRVTRLTVAVTPRRARPTQRVRFRGAGFTADAPVYAHYVRHGRLERTVRLVRRPTGACGLLDVRRPQFPFMPRLGRWRLQVDQRRRFSPKPRTPLVRLRIDVRRG